MRAGQRRPAGGHALEQAVVHAEGGLHQLALAGVGKGRTQDVEPIGRARRWRRAAACRRSRVVAMMR